MSGQKIQSHLREKPFVPFRLTMTDGTSHVVAKADTIEVVPRKITVVRGSRRIELCPREIVSLERA